MGLTAESSKSFVEFDLERVTGVFVTRQGNREPPARLITFITIPP
jgi:hypothetical protein